MEDCWYRVDEHEPMNSLLGMGEMWLRDKERRRVHPQFCLSQETGFPVQGTQQQLTLEGRSADKARKEFEAEGASCTCKGAEHETTGSWLRWKTASSG